MRCATVICLIDTDSHLHWRGNMLLEANEKQIRKMEGNENENMFLGGTIDLKWLLVSYYLIFFPFI